MARKPNAYIRAHLEWIGFVRPTGLVVSAAALNQAGVVLNRTDREGQNRLRDCLEKSDSDAPVLPDFEAFARRVLDWNFSPQGYAGTDEVPIPSDLELPLPDAGEVVRPDFAVRTEPLIINRQTEAETETPWQLLVTVHPPETDFDLASSAGGGLELSPHSRIERLLRHTHVPAGLLFNGRTIRLISAPRGESSGWMDFQVANMALTAGRPICSAMRLLLGQNRLLSVPTERRLAGLLSDSRKFQNEVSERLAEQVLHALYELLRGFQAAQDASNGRLLRHWLDQNPDEIYRGLLTVVLRLVYLLYTEERDLLPQDETFLSSYSVSGLYKQLQADASRHPDTLDQRFGAYARLIALWRMVHDGAQGEGMRMTAKHGDLFHPDRYPFLEGRTNEEARQTWERIDPPRVGDGVIYRVLEKLIVLDSERISYRALDVEHIGSVYETMMGFRLETASGRSLAIKAAKKHGAPATVNLEELLEEEPSKRANWIKARSDRKLTAKVNKAVKAAETLEELHAALNPVIDHDATPDLVATGAMVLQPSEERRRSGSHYTPRELTEPIVRTALKPILDRLSTEAGGPIRPDQILDLKVCDPAMGSAAFLVEACRQLADRLIEAWRAHDSVPEIPTDEDETILARRMVAQRCLYGVDRNPKAVDLAKLSLWLTTLSKDHPLTFLDHALRYGDSLVGLTKRQIQAFHWKGNAPHFQAGFEALRSQEHIDRANQLRKEIREADDSVSDQELRHLWQDSRHETDQVRMLGDLVIAAFFEESKAKDREARRKEYATAVINGEADQFQDRLNELRNSDPPLAPFHWEIEFPEVFDRPNPGFDVIVGNPPFLGGKRIKTVHGSTYRDWLSTLNHPSNRNADLVAHFFRNSFSLIREEGTLGLIATNTISQGDTRTSGLRWICTNGGHIYSAYQRVSWPGLAQVIISVVHVSKGEPHQRRYLDGKPVEQITAFLYSKGTHDDPARLDANQNMSYIGCFIRGMGFTFDDQGSEAASPIALMRELLRNNPANRSIVHPYIGGNEINAHPLHQHHRYVIHFQDYPLQRVRREWPDLLRIVESQVRPYRESLPSSPINNIHRKNWWLFANARPALTRTIEGLDRLLVTCRVSQYTAFTFLPTGMVYADSLVCFPFGTYAAFCVLQSRPHEMWARFFGSSLGDGPRYTPSDCFETFPFPEGWTTRPDLESVGQEYYEYRAALMVRNDEGMTATYNRFHNPLENDPDIVELRRLHSAMDRAVLDAYGWTDLPTDCEFLLDYEIDEEAWGKKKKPYRYRWPDEVRDEMLARLLELNAQRAAEEARLGPTGSGPTNLFEAPT